MSLLVPDVGEQEMLKRILNYSATGDLVLHLYTNDVTPAEGDTVSTYTESTAAGYGASTLTGTDWTITTTTGTTEASYPQVTFTYTDTEPNVYGYYVTDSGGTILIWAERFSDGPYNIPSSGGEIKITPKIQLD